MCSRQGSHAYFRSALQAAPWCRKRSAISVQKTNLITDCSQWDCRKVIWRQCDTNTVREYPNQSHHLGPYIKVLRHREVYGVQGPEYNPQQLGQDGSRIITWHLWIPNPLTLNISQTYFYVCRSRWTVGNYLVQVNMVRLSVNE